MSYKLTFKYENVKSEVTMEIGDGPISIAKYAHSLCGVTDLYSDLRRRYIEGLSQTIPCTKGCSKCCSHLIYVSPPEAIFIHEMCQLLPRLTRDKVASNAAQVKRKTVPMELDGTSDDFTLMTKYARKHFDLNIYCPYLDNNECLIYNFRPHICREYVVVGDRADCQIPEKITTPDSQLRLDHFLVELWSVATMETPTVVSLASIGAWASQGYNNVGIKNTEKLFEMLKAWIDNDGPDENSNIFF